MSPSQKPEWIEIAEKDSSVIPHKVSKALPVMALVVTASILGMGNLFAHNAEEGPATAIEITAPAVPISQSTDLTTATVATQSIENPLIGTLPTVGEEDDELLGYDSDDDDLDDSDEVEDDESDEGDEDDLDEDEDDEDDD